MSLCLIHDKAQCNFGVTFTEASMITFQGTIEEEIMLHKWKHEHSDSSNYWNQLCFQTLIKCITNSLKKK